MKKFFCNLIIIFFIISTHSIANEKIVFIDLNYIFLNSNAGKELNSQILKKNSNFKSELNDFKKKIDSEKNKLLAQKNVLSVEEYNKKISSLENEISNANDSFAKRSKDLNSFKKKTETLFSQKLNLIIEEYSVENSIDIILDKKNLLMAKKNLDITNEILNLFNEKVKNIEIN